MKIKYRYDLNITDDDLDTGIKSFVSWDRLKPQLNEAFMIRSFEKIVGITITKEGISAKIETINKQP